MMVFILFGLFFFLTLTFTSFKKAFFLRHFNELIKGKVIEVSSTDEGVFLIVEYFVDEKKLIYKHRFSNVKLPKEKLEFLVFKYLNANFYLLGKKQGDKLVEVTSYASVKIVKWIYLCGFLSMCYLVYFLK